MCRQSSDCLPAEIIRVTLLPIRRKAIASTCSASTARTCIAIENGVKEVIETDFAAQVAAGEVRFRMIDIAKSENEALADKYEVAWSSLLLNRWRDGRETVTDLTKFAFANVRTNPKKFKAELRAEIQRQIDE